MIDSKVMREHTITKILIDPRFQISYSSYYIEGIRRVWRKRMKFSVLRDLPELTTKDISHGMAVKVYLEDGMTFKVYIDHHDTTMVVNTMYEWCDRYAKVNLGREDLNRSKMMAIGPSFAVKLWNPFATLVVASRNYVISYGLRSLWGNPVRILNNLRAYYHGYVYLLYRRKFYAEYESPFVEDQHYVFTLNTLWYDKKSDSTTTRFRGAFIRACKACYDMFEGGFYYIDSTDVLKQFPEYTKYLHQYDDVLVKKRVSMKKYLEKIKKSSIVFNTPAVGGCHGWKMAEYMAMGKAMISTPILNEMPEPLIDGQHMLLVNDEMEIWAAVERLKNDEELRRSIGSNSREYFNKYLSPDKVVRRILCF